MISPPDLDEKVLSALDQIMSFHRGRKEAIKFASLHASVKSSISPLTVGERSLRELIEERRATICSCTANPGGYFLPSDDPETRRAEVNGTAQMFAGYEAGARRRKEAIKKAYPNEIQGRLFEEARP